MDAGALPPPTHGLSVHSLSGCSAQGCPQFLAACPGFYPTHPDLSKVKSCGRGSSFGRLRAMARKLPIVEVEWTDSAATKGWSRDPKQFTGPGVCGGVSHCRTVGYLLERNSNQVVVVQNQADDTESLGEGMAIPTSCVKRIKRLR